MKKKVMNIRPQEFTDGGERSVRYKGSDGKMHDISAGSGGSDGGSTAQSGNIVLEVNFADDGKTFNADELIAIITGLLAGRGLICISDNNWGTQNERRIAYLTRVNGFEIVDENITIGNTLKFEFAKSTFGDLDSIYFLKQQDGSYQLSHYFNK